MNANIKENKMGVAPVGNLLFKMAIPMIISMLVQALYNIVDSIFVSEISEDALTAVSLAFPLQTLMLAFGLGSSLGVNTLISRSLGAKDRDSARKAANCGLFLAFCNYVFFAIAGLLLSRPFFAMQTDSQAILNMGVSYATVCLVGSFGLFEQLAFEKILQSTAKTSLSMITQLVGAVVNIILDPIFIFGWLGLPEMGVTGAAIATVLGQLVGALTGLIFCIKYNKEVPLNIKEIKFDKKIVKEIYRVGLPSIVMQSIGSVMTFGMNTILMGLTSTASAVFGAYFKLQSFVFMPTFGLNNAMVPIISYNYGAKRKDRVNRTIKLTVWTAVIIMIFGLLIFELLPTLLLSMFNASETMLNIGAVALRVIASHFLLAGFNIVAGSVFQAIGNPIHSMIVSVCRQLVVLLPAAFLLSLSGSVNIVWLAFPIAEIVSFALCLYYFIKTVKVANAKMTEINYKEALTV
ncbi:MAG: MATE family efflux transporter [Clostridia bacterium]|nr:MATE family efflux transporter [Clostridia bacterium]